MNERVRILCEEAAKLTPEERVELVERISLTLLDRQTEIDEAWDREAASRFEAYDRGEMGSVSWEEIKKRRASK
jgi:putative addiction module component (TIGR02574 family)